MTELTKEALSGAVRAAAVKAGSTDERRLLNYAAGEIERQGNEIERLKYDMRELTEAINRTRRAAKELGEENHALRNPASTEKITAQLEALKYTRAEPSGWTCKTLAHGRVTDDVAESWNGAIDAAILTITDWAVTRAGDPTFPRLVISESDADKLVRWVELAPKAAKLPLHSAPPAQFPPSGLSVINPDEWIPCSPEYLKSRRHACSEAPRVWCEEEKNHYHPKNWPTDKTPPVVPDAMRETLYKIANHIAGGKGGLPIEWQDWAEEIEVDIRRAAMLQQSAITGLHNEGASSDAANSPAIPGDCVLVPLEIIDRFPEINVVNYNHGDVCALNSWGCELVLAADPRHDHSAADTDHADLSLELVEIPVERNENGYWSHPTWSALFSGLKRMPRAKLESFLKSKSLEYTYIELEYDSDNQDAAVHYFVNGSCDVSAWKPTRPNGDGWFIVSIHETEDGPVCFWVRPIPQMEGGAV